MKSYACIVLVLFLLPVAGFAVAPTVGTITPTDSVSLAESSIVTVWCNATITDDDGFADVMNVNATLWNPAATTEDAADSGDNHYTNASCTLSGGDGTTVNAACAFSMQYYADPAEWTCKLTAADNTSATGTNNITTVTLNGLKALSTDSTVAFSELALGATSGEQSITVTNTGNTQIDVSVDGYGSSDGDGYAMTCSIGGSEIPLSKIKYNLTSGQDFDTTMTSLTDIAVILADFDLVKTTDGTPSTKAIFWKLRMPSSDVGGSCSGKIVVTAV